VPLIWAHMLGCGRNDLFYVQLDIWHFDQSALASIISLIMLMPLLALRDDGSEAYRITRAFLLIRAHGIANKIVKWNDFEYRWIIGEIVSGLLATSWLDTEYMEIAMLIVNLYIYDQIKLKDPSRAARFQKSFLRRLQYGDNSLYAYEEEFYDDVIGEVTPDYPLGNMQRILFSVIGLKCKPSETFLFRPDSTGISPLFSIIRPIFSNGKVVAHDVVRRGPEFLKRLFVNLTRRGKTHIMPWRHEDDFYTKSCISSTSDITEQAKWTSKYLGLMIDTMATNSLAYDAMRDMFYGSTGSKDPVSLEYVETLMEMKVKKDGALINQKILARTGIDPSQYAVSFDPNGLFDQFTWDDEWRNNWASANNLWLYDKFGCKQKPVSQGVQFAPVSLRNLNDDFIFSYSP